MSDDDKEVVKFVGRFARSYIAYNHLLETVLGLGDQMYTEYEKLSDSQKKITCRWCAQVIHDKILGERNAG